MAFPEGLPPTTVTVHPTQLYEAVVLVAIAWLLFRWRRQRLPDAFVLGGYLLLTSTVRFLIEFIRINERVALGMTVAQWVALALATCGGLLMLFSRQFFTPELAQRGRTAK